MLSGRGAPSHGSSVGWERSGRAELSQQERAAEQRITRGLEPGHPPLPAKERSAASSRLHSRSQVVPWCPFLRAASELWVTGCAAL